MCKSGKDGIIMDTELKGVRKITVGGIYSGNFKQPPESEGPSNSSYQRKIF